MNSVYELLPPGGLDQSIVLAVLVGVWVALLFTETLGWVFVGLVVPGYLASVLVVQPTTAAVIVAEAVLTYFIARALAYALSPTGVWAPFFGRDRFFLIVIASVLVRQHDQLWLLPALSSLLEGQFDLALPPVREFYSIGLVLVPLTANLLWKPGAVRGLGQLAVVTGLTYLVLSGVLLEYTNLSLSSFELLYEDTALDFLGNAKSYVLLLTTAAVAARFNLRYGWDFGGILVPALLGLLWFTPTELAITVGEALVLWMATLGVLRFTPLGRWNLEGPRKIALVFTLSVVLKWLLSLGVGDRLVGLRPRDLFGFGYLLSSLLALRMLQRKSARKVLLPTLATALAGWLLGSLLGFGLDLAAPLTAAPPAGPQVASQRLLRTPLGALALARVQAELAPVDSPALPSASRVAHAGAWAAIATWSLSPNEDREHTALEAAHRADLLIVPLLADHGPRRSHAVLAAERGGATGQGLGVVWPGAPGIVITVPRPVSEAPVAEVAGLLALAIDARAVLVSERDVPRIDDDRFARARERLAPSGDLELRGDASTPRGQPVLHVEQALPQNLDLRALGPAPPRLEWSEPPGLDGPAWGRGTRVVLRIHPDDLRAMLAADAPTPHTTPALLPWLAARERGPVLRPLGPAAVPSAAELVFLERRVAAPLLAEPSGDSLQIAGRMAGLVDHVIWNIDRCGAGPCRALTESSRPLAAGWGALVVGTGPSGLVIEAPHAADEPGTGRLAAELWSAANGRVLVIGGAAPVLGPHAPIQALHQAALSAHSDAAVLQIRGVGVRPGLAETVVVGLGQPVLDERPLPPVFSDMFLPEGPLAWVSKRILADGSPELGPLAGGGNAQIEYATALVGAPVAVLWFPPALRRAYAPHDPCAELARLAMLELTSGCAPVDEIAAITTSATTSVTVTHPNGTTTTTMASVPEAAAEPTLDFEAALAEVERYADNGDLHLLRRVVAAGWTLRAGLGQTTGRAFVVMARRRGPRALVWLGPAAGGRELLTGAPSRWRKTLWTRVRSLILGEATK